MRTQTANSPGIRKRDLTRHGICGHLDLGLPACKNVRSQVLLFKSHPVYGVLLEQPKWTKTNYFLTMMLISLMKDTLVMAAHAPDTSPLLFSYEPGNWNCKVISDANALSARENKIGSFLFAGIAIQITVIFYFVES